MFWRTLLFGFLFLGVSATAYAQNTGGVFGPTVNEGHESLQYRIAIDPDNANGDTGIAQRLHFQQALDTRFMWRVVGQVRKTNRSDFDFDYVQAELFWDMSEDKAAYKTGLRFDGRLRGDNRPSQFGVNWMNEFDLGEGWRARVLALTSVEGGSRANSGVALQSRGQLMKSLGAGRSLGLEMYNSYGRTGNIGKFSTQNHTIGPVYSAPLTEGISIFTGALFGISEAAPDTEFRLWITKSL